MKRNLLFCLAVCFGLSLHAQNRVVKKSVTAPDKVKVEGTVTIQNSAPIPGPVQPSQKSASVTLIQLGQSANGYGAIGKKTELWADPRINTVTYVHRADVTPGSGYLMYDISTDGGATWQINQGPIYDASLNSPARYPQGVIYNPAGNTNPANAYLSYHAPTLAATNGASWGGLAYGVQKLDGVTPPTQHEDVTTNNPGFWWQVPFNMTITQDGEIWIADSNDSIATNVEQTGHIWIAHGTHSAGDVSYTRTLMQVPFSPMSAISGTDVAFGASGMVGYIASIGHFDDVFEPDSLYYLAVWKTTDGGTTWSASPTQINVSTLVDPILASSANDKYNTGFELDLAVDVNDNLHIFTAVGPAEGGFSIGTDPDMWGLFDIYTTDGGTTWDAFLVSKPMTFRGTFDPNAATPLDEDSRPQIAKTMDGTKLFYVYFDTDTNSFQNEGNRFPDAWVMGHDIVTGNKTMLMNMTVGTQADGIVTFGAVAHWVFEGATTYEIPIAFQQLINDQSLQPTQFYYIDDIIINDSDFITSVDEISNIASVGMFPNPFSESATVYVGLTNAADVKITVTNALGMTIMEVDKGKLEAGSHQFELNRTNLSSGMYFYTITAGDNTVTKKMIVR